MFLGIAGLLLLLVLVVGGCFLLMRNVPRELDPASWTHSYPLHFLRSLLWGCVKSQGVLTSEWKVDGITDGNIKFPDQETRKALISTCKAIRFNSVQYAKYREVCGYSTKDGSDPTSLGALCFPHTHFMRHIYALVNSQEFLASPLGLIHIHGTVSVYSTMPAILSQMCDSRSSISAARMGEKGIEIDFTNLVYIEGTLVWKSVYVLLSRNLKMMSKLKGKKIQKSQSQKCLTVDQKVSVAADTGVRFASIAGDYFPQHLYPWSARLLGYKLPIVQGMWTVERAVAAIQEENSQSLDLPISISFSFKRPLHMPSEIHILYSNPCFDQNQKKIQFEVRDETLQVLHVTGEITSGSK